MEMRETLENKAREIQGQVRPELDAVKEKLGALNEQVVSFVKAHPAQCLLGAVALGYLAGRLARSGSWFGHGKD